MSSPLYKIEGSKGIISRCVFWQPDTHRSKWYSEKKFLHIEIGMNQSEVVRILGEPLYVRQSNNSHVLMQYSESPSSTHYGLRQVEILDGRVTRKLGYYYID